MKTQAIIVAAGSGRRLKSKTLKPFVPIAGRPLLVYSLKVLEAHPDIDGIVVVGVKKHLKAFEKLAMPFQKVRAVVPGGATRRDSVKCGIKALSEDTDLVLVHDAARPFIDRPMISRLLAALRKSKAAITGVPVKFTVKQVDRRTHNIQETPPRQLLWEAQTPQGFHKHILVEAHAQSIPEEATDDAVLVERMGERVKMVMGSWRNIKITTHEDVVLARQLYQG